MKRMKNMKCLKNTAFLSILVIAIAKCQRAKISPISARFFNLFRNVMNYRSLQGGKNPGPLARGLP